MKNNNDGIVKGQSSHLGREDYIRKYNIQLFLINSNTHKKIMNKLFSS